MEKSQSNVSIPLPPYFANLAIFPSPYKESESRFFLLKNTDKVPVHGLSSVSVKYYPDAVYCFFPSDDENIGTVTVYPNKPCFLDEFTYCLEMSKKAMKLHSSETDHLARPLERRDEVSSDNRCSTCFVSHFPRPNTKLCKGGKLEKKKKEATKKTILIRLRGGARNDQTKNMINRAIHNGKFME